MMNLNGMTSKQLKELGKQHGIKNWWNLSKAVLISALSEIDSHEPEEMNVKAEVEEMPEAETEIEADNSTPAETESSEVEQTNTKVEDEEMTEVKSGTKKPNLKIHDLTFEGKTQSIRAWAEELEMPWPTLYDRVNRNGWTVEEALTIPLGGRRSKK